MRGELKIWTIYHDPKDYPGKYVVRGVPIGQSPAWRPDAVVDSLEEARAAVPPFLYRLPSDPLDDPVIVECWI